MRIHAFHHLYQHRLSLSTKPFNARGCKVERCGYCQVSLEHCLCSVQPDIETSVAVMLIVSENEVFKPSNTGRLIADVVKESYVYQWSRTEPNADMLSLLTNENYAPMLVFPEDYIDDKQRLLTHNPITVEQGRKPLLILLDGSWREARRIYRKSAYLASLPVISITPQSISQYMMRKSENENHLSTAEVASLVLKQVGEAHAASTLELWFETFRESYLLSKTRIKPDLTKPALNRYLAARENANSF
ncbi:tRNA-uridine aminocarboxypropyltransferase [Vibrio sp. NTOU-M3]|uniref:tRNA-uridine aminocarboxypropyltransferase n=1 Tax=Vibrio sp. NTOU-M3 TaxID=3234954 RepID=UPI00349F84F3